MSLSPTDAPASLPNRAGVGVGVGVGVGGWPARALQQLRRATRHGAAHTLFVHAGGGVSAFSPAARGEATDPQPYVSAAEWCTARRGQAANVVVSGHLLFSLHVSAALPLGDAAALRTYAQQQFGHYHGAQAQAWPLAVWAEARQRVACALHGIDLLALRAQAEAHGVHLRCVVPAWAAALRSALQQVPSLASGRRAVVLVEGTLVTWMLLDRGTLAGLCEQIGRAHV